MKRLEDVKESKPITLISQQIKLQIFTFTILLYLIGRALESSPLTLLDGLFALTSGGHLDFTAGLHTTGRHRLI